MKYTKKGEVVMSLKTWARKNGLMDVYEAYASECESLRELYEDHTDDLELAISQIQDSYPELFGGDEDA